MGAAASSRREAVDAARTSPAALQWQDATKLFAEIDADSDGTITGAELASVLEAHGYPQGVAATLMEEMDIDKDGAIAFEEWKQRFYSSSFCSVKQPPGEDFGDLLPPGAGCVVEDTARRGITPTQLSRVKTHIQRRCGAERWLNWDGKTLGPNQVSLCAVPLAERHGPWHLSLLPPLQEARPSRPPPLRPPYATLAPALCRYETARYVIKPATYVKECSLVELIATGEQPPLYFVSHW